MTYIEFFDKIAIENICACLTRAPEKVIFIGNNKKLMTAHIKRYNTIFSNRGKNIEFVYKSVNINKLNSIIQVLSEIVESENECIFDLTGGDDLVLAAIGIIYERYKDKNIQMHRFNIRSNTITDCDDDGVDVLTEVPLLSVEENVQLYGGDIVYCADKPDTTYIWTNDTEFKNDINSLWEICKNDVRLWNTQIGVLEAAELFREADDEKLLTVANANTIANHLANKNAKFIFIKSIFNRLYKSGLITYYKYENDIISIVYKNEQVKRCLVKAGRVLEMKIYTTALDLKNEDDSNYYNDVVNGAFIDWDGDIHEEGMSYDTENEIDIILMKGLVPVFVSCKNGHVTIDELYKLNTVTERFGGKYAKKVLVATSLKQTGEFGEYFRQRAIDMNIRLVENVQSMNESKLSHEVSLWWHV